MASIRFVSVLLACALLAFVSAVSQALEAPACGHIEFTGTKEPSEIARENWNCLDCCIRAGHMMGTSLVQAGRGKFCHCSDEI